MTQYKIKNLVTGQVADTLYATLTAGEIQVARLIALVPNYRYEDFEVFPVSENMLLRDIKIGEIYFVSKGSEDGTFQEGDRIRLGIDTRLYNRSARGWLEENEWKNYVDEVEVE